MSKIKGKLIICNRCGTEGFQKFVGMVDHYGGFSQSTERYEELPDGWMYLTELGDLCPECAQIFKSFIKHFMVDKDIALAWRIIDHELVNMECITNDIALKTPTTELHMSED